MKVKLDYGKNGLMVDIDPSLKVDIFKAKNLNPLENLGLEIQRAIDNPIHSKNLREIIKSKSEINNVCIVVSDATRPVPSYLILESLIPKLNEYGIDNEKITILIATGLHRKSQEEELDRILGPKIKNKIKHVDHCAKDENSLKYLGKTKENIPIWINKLYCESDLKILTGYVEPHFFFGFSGGAKSIVPGIAGVNTILENHSARNIASPHARFGIFKKNPLAENSREIVELVGVDFTVNVCINSNHEIIKVAAGSLEQVHDELINFQLKNVFKKITQPYDVVICGNGGYPLDLNLYQAVKSMAIGELAVKEGGTIISVNECIDGIGVGQDDFKKLLFSGLEPSKLYQKIINGEIKVPDQWEIQILARILMKAEIIVVSSLKPEDLGNIGLKHANSVEEALHEASLKHGNDMRVLVLPNGPLILPKLDD
ncbi:MAG: nickel-dependent lactate racemase [Promethearchaeota archaeon]